jgi:hypothetical protein
MQAVTQQHVENEYVFIHAIMLCLYFDNATLTNSLGLIKSFSIEWQDNTFKSKAVHWIGNWVAFGTQSNTDLGVSDEADANG